VFRIVSNKTRSKTLTPEENFIGRQTTLLPQNSVNCTVTLRYIEICRNVSPDIRAQLIFFESNYVFSTLNAELNPICHLLALLGAHLLLQLSRIRVNPYPANVEKKVSS
jgi:hypothetical protein